MSKYDGWLDVKNIEYVMHGLDDTHAEKAANIMLEVSDQHPLLVSRGQWLMLRAIARDMVQRSLKKHDRVLSNKNDRDAWYAQEVPGLDLSEASTARAADLELVVNEVSNAVSACPEYDLLRQRLQADDIL